MVIQKEGGYAIPLEMVFLVCNTWELCLSMGLIELDFVSSQVVSKRKSETEADWIMPRCN